MLIILCAVRCTFTQHFTLQMAARILSEITKHVFIAAIMLLEHYICCLKHIHLC